MISLPYCQAPPCLAEFAISSDLVDFNKDLSFHSCKREVRQRLLQNQRQQCAYCESLLQDIENSSHLDHLEPQTSAPGRRFDINNLVASCQNNATCGHKHGAHPVPDELNPYLAAKLHTAMPCDSGGELYTDSLPDHAWKFAELRLNLNAPGLKSIRAEIIRKLRLQTIASGTGARRRLASLSTQGVGFISLHAQELGRFGFSI